MDWGLFTAALLSSTLLPGGSEALLLLRLAEGGPTVPLVLTATVGNVAGGLLTYLVGRAGHRLLLSRWLRIDAADLARAERWFSRWGRPVLLFAWLPIVGDPLCLLAGMLRVGIGSFLLLVSIGKLARYAVLAAAASASF
ncbi:MAG: DedA family protein [Gammaproteobacteria bacterium]|nr:DedA family protein [Gammaproteobacteria bacterium]